MVVGQEVEFEDISDRGVDILRFEIEVACVDDDGLGRGEAGGSTQSQRRAEKVRAMHHLGGRGSESLEFLYLFKMAMLVMFVPRKTPPGFLDLNSKVCKSSNLFSLKKAVGDCG